MKKTDLREQAAASAKKITRGPIGPPEIEILELPSTIKSLAASDD